MNSNAFVVRSPLYGDDKDKYPQYNTDYALKLLMKLGADKEKLVVGIPFYGQTFSLSSKKPNQGYGSLSDGPGEPGEVTNQPGMLAYNEICNRLRRPGWTLGRDPTGKSGPYATSSNQWVGFDDVQAVTLKTKYVVNAGYGGIAAWTVDLDDFMNRCCLESFPLLRAINRALGRLNTPEPTGNNCQRPPIPVTPTPPVMAATVDTGAAGIPNQSTTQNDQYTRPQTTTTSPWWTQPTTTKRQTRPQTTSEATTRWSTSTTTRRTTTAGYNDGTTIPVPVNVQPVSIDGPCEAGEYRAHPTKCSDYLVCSNNKFITLYCPAGLHWNSRNNHCDWPSSAKCTISGGPTEVTTMRPINTRRTTPTTQIYSTQTTQRLTTQTRRSTTRTTQRPMTTTTRRTTPTSRRTTRYTTEEPTTTNRPTYYETTTQYWTTTSRRPNRKPAPCVNGHYYPHKDCKKYYVCNNGKRTPGNCPDGTQFSEQLQTCDFEENVGCVSKKKYLKLLLQQYKRSGIFNAALLRASEGDPCDGYTLHAYPGQCSKYLECVHKNMMTRDCAGGLYFDPSTNNCNWPDQVDCKNSDEYETNEVEEDEENEGEEEDEEKPEEGINIGGSSSQIPEFEFDQGNYKPSSTTSRPSSTSVGPFSESFETIPVPETVEPLNGEFKLVCYFTNWAWYRPGIGKYLPDDVDENLCTHIVYGFAVLNYDELTIRTHDSWADIDNKFYDRVVAFKQKGVKVTLAIGGWNDSAGDKYSRLVRNPTARAKFIRHVIEFLEKYGFEGELNEAMQST